MTDKTTKTYNRYCLERDAEVQNGAKHYTALECYNNQNGAKREYELSSDGSIKMEILYNIGHSNAYIMPLLPIFDLYSYFIRTLYVSLYISFDIIYFCEY